MITAKSIVIIPGDGAVYEVVGDPEDYSHGPVAVPRFPTSNYVLIRPFLPATEPDSYGNETGTFDTTRRLNVYGWAPTSSPKTVGVEQTLVELELWAPPAYVINLRRTGPR